MPLLVNPDHLMPDDYYPTVVSVGGNYKLESKAAAARQDMQAAASRDGVPLWIISAYRTLERQTELYQEKVEEYKNLGSVSYTHLDVYKRQITPSAISRLITSAAVTFSLAANSPTWISSGIVISSFWRLCRSISKRRIFCASLSLRENWGRPR